MSLRQITLAHEAKFFLIVIIITEHDPWVLRLRMIYHVILSCEVFPTSTKWACIPHSKLRMLRLLVPAKRWQCTEAIVAYDACEISFLPVNHLLVPLQIISCVEFVAETAFLFLVATIYVLYQSVGAWKFRMTEVTMYSIPMSCHLMAFQGVIRDHSYVADSASASIECAYARMGDFHVLCKLVRIGEFLAADVTFASSERLERVNRYIFALYSYRWPQNRGPLYYKRLGWWYHRQLGWWYHRWPKLCYHSDFRSHVWQTINILFDYSPDFSEELFYLIWQRLAKHLKFDDV